MSKGPIWLFAGLLVLGSPAAQAQQASSDVSATNLDGVLKALSADPRGKQAVAALIMLKGIGRQQGDTVTWHVEFKAGHLTVNGVDVSQLVPRQAH